MTPRPTYRIFRAAWVMARAFTPSPVQAVLAIPWTLLSIIPGTLRGGLYMDRAGTGMVLLYRSRMLLDMLVLLPLVLLAGVGIGAVLAAVVMHSPSILLGVAVAFMLVIPFLQATRHLVAGQGGSLFPWGPETPKGQRWEIAGLAQLPGTRMAGTQLALRALNTVPPPGAVIVATAGTEKLYQQYQRHGFIGGPKRRVHRLAD